MCFHSFCRRHIFDSNQMLLNSDSFVVCEYVKTAAGNTRRVTRHPAFKQCMKQPGRKIGSRCIGKQKRSTSFDVQMQKHCAHSKRKFSNMLLKASAAAFSLCYFFFFFFSPLRFRSNTALRSYCISKVTWDDFRADNFPLY